MNPQAGRKGLRPQSFAYALPAQGREPSAPGHLKMQVKSQKGSAFRKAIESIGPPRDQRTLFVL